MGASTVPSSASTVPAARTQVLAARRCGPGTAATASDRPPGCGPPPAAPRCPCPGGARCRAGRGRPAGFGQRRRGPGSAPGGRPPASRRGARRPWWTTSPAGLSTTISSASSCTTVNVDRGIGHRDVELLGRRVDLEALPAAHRRAARHDGPTVEAHSPALDQIRHRRGAGSPLSSATHPVRPAGRASAPGTTTSHRRATLERRPRRVPSADRRGVGHRGLIGPPQQHGGRRSRPPRCTESATLNVGQKCSAMKSMTDPWLDRNDPVASGCPAPLPTTRPSATVMAVDWTRRTAPSNTSTATTASRTEHRGPALGEAEGGAGVVGQLEVELPHHVDRSVRRGGPRPTTWWPGRRPPPRRRRPRR